MLEVLQLLDELHFLAQQQDQQANDLLIHAFFDRDSAVLLESDSGDVLEWLNGRRVNVVQKPYEIYLFLVSVQSEQYLDLIIGLDNSVFLEYLQRVFASDESFSA